MIANNDILNQKAYQSIINAKIKNFKLADLMISIEPSNVCNAECIMCPYPKMTRKKEIMSMDFFKTIAADCLSNGIKNFNFNFYNEPFLDPHIFERIKFLKSKGARIQLFSNASIIDQKTAKQIFNSGLDEIILSIDSTTKKNYESIRKKLNFEVTTNNILHLIEKRKSLKLKYPKIKLNFVEQKINGAELKEFQSFWADKVDKIYFSCDDQRNEISRPLKNLNNKTSTFPCLRIWSELIIMSNGRVPLCCVDYDGKIILGDFNKQNLKKIWGNTSFKRIRKLHLDFKADRIPLCKKCLNLYRMNVRIMDHK
ncbi:MAG: radical SAM/SPASM domain-containing protein [Candidatus Berkelbacteria bacterium]|nr:radical SAM/SPASM domain-containing protein [Candidatus Berkelbacteria bacterium]